MPTPLSTMVPQAPRARPRWFAYALVAIAVQAVVAVMIRTL